MLSMWVSCRFNQFKVGCLFVAVVLTKGFFSEHFVSLHLSMKKLFLGLEKKNAIV